MGPGCNPYAHCVRSRYVTARLAVTLTLILTLTLTLTLTRYAAARLAGRARRAGGVSPAAPRAALPSGGGLPQAELASSSI